MMAERKQALQQRLDALRQPVREYFSPLAGTRLIEQTPSYGVGATDSRGRTNRYGTLGDVGVPGSQLHADQRPRQGDIPAPRGTRRRPPYGEKGGGPDDRSGPRIAPLHATGSDYLPPQEQDPAKDFRTPRARGHRTQPRAARPSRRQGEMSKLLSKEFAHIERATIMAKRAELTLVHAVLTDQLHKRRAKDLGVPEDLACYLPPETLADLHKQHAQQRHHQAVAALGELPNGNFWARWLQAAQTGTELSP